MNGEDRDILDILTNELNFVEKGGYGRSVKTPQIPASVFQDSPTCLCFPYRTHDDRCALMKMVPPGERSESVPCHRIPLNSKGETLEDIESRGDQQEIEEAVRAWLSEKIKEIKKERQVV